MRCLVSAETLSVKGNFLGERLQPSNSTALLSTNSLFSLNSTEISVIPVLKGQGAPRCRIVNVALLPALTYLCEMDRSTRMITPQVDRHVKVPKDKFAFLEFIGLVIDTGIILESKSEVELRMSLHKIDRYFYETISRPL